MKAMPIAVCEVCPLNENCEEKGMEYRGTKFIDIPGPSCPWPDVPEESMDPALDQRCRYFVMELRRAK